MVHPFYSTLDLHWTGSGDWQDIPKEPSQVIKEDEDIEKYNMARKEPYITPEGEKVGHCLWNKAFRTQCMVPLR